MTDRYRCSECYFVFKMDSGRKYVDCPECKSELNVEKLERVFESEAKPTAQVSFLEKLKQMNEKKQKPEN